MCKILISIRPEYVEKIILGLKRYEYRTKVAKKDIDAIIIYCTYPTKKVLAEVKIRTILSDTPEGLWERTKEYSGITKRFFDKYFSGKEKAYAYELGEVIRYSRPKELKEFGCAFPPQSYVYINV